MQIDGQDNDVRLRRVIEEGKSYYLLDGKLIDRIEVKNLLVTLGFSKVYPYFFSVHQQHVEDMMRQNSGDRINLLRKMTGLDEIEKMADKSNRILEEADEEKERIVQYLAKITAHLDAAENKQKSFEALSGLKKNMELLVQLKQECVQVSVLEQKKLFALKNRNEMLEKMESLRDAQKSHRKTVTDANQSLNLMKHELCALEQLKCELLMQKSQMAENIAALGVGVLANTDSDWLRQCEQVARILNLRIAGHQRKLEKMDARSGQIDQRVAELNRQLEDLVQQRRNVVMGQASIAGGLKFFSIEARNRWIEQELETIKLQTKKETTRMKKLMREMELGAMRKQELDGSFQAQSAILDEIFRKIDETESQLQESSQKQKDFETKRA